VANSTLTGTSGNELLGPGGVVSTLVEAGGGDDTVTLVLSADEVNGGAGNDSITLAGTAGPEHVVSGGTGSDTVYVNTQSVTIGGTINMNEGTDTFNNTSVQMVNASFGGNQGADTITILAGSTNLTMGGGADADMINLTGGTFTTSKLIGGGGADTLDLHGGTFTLSTVQASDGHDIVNASGATITNSIVALGKGSDSISVGKTNTNASIAGGALGDTINVISQFGGGIIYGDGLGVTTGGATNGADIIGSTQMELSVASTIYAGGGNDTIRFNSAGEATGSSGGSVVIDGGDGNDLIGNTAAIWSYSASTIAGGYGDDSIVMNGFGISGQLILGGEGADTIYVVNNSGNGSINGGAGADSIYINGTGALVNEDNVTATHTINGGAGTDTINFAGNWSTLTAAGLILTTYSSISQVSQNLGSVVYGSGDIIKISDTTLTVSAADWAGAGGQIWVMSTLTAISAWQANANVTDGSVAAYSDGTDSILLISPDASASQTIAITVLTADLVTTTSVGLVNNTTSNVGFTLAANTGTAGAASSGGLVITLA